MHVGISFTVFLGELKVDKRELLVFPFLNWMSRNKLSDHNPNLYSHLAWNLQLDCQVPVESHAKIFTRVQKMWKSIASWRTVRTRNWPATFTCTPEASNLSNLMAEFWHCIRLLCTCFSNGFVYPKRDEHDGRSVHSSSRILQTRLVLLPAYCLHEPHHFGLTITPFFKKKTIVTLADRINRVKTKPLPLSHVLASP